MKTLDQLRVRYAEPTLDPEPGPGVSVSVRERLKRLAEAARFRVPSAFFSGGACGEKH